MFSAKATGGRIQPNQRLISINNTNVIKEKLLPNDVIAIIKTTPTTITITVETSPSTYTLWTSEKDAHPPSIPAWFLDKGIPNNVWDLIYKIYTEELIPELIKSNKMEHIFENEMNNYRNKQVWKSDGREADHERKVYMMVHQSSVLLSNINLIITKLLSVSNALLNPNPYNIMASVQLTSKTLPTYSTKQTSTTIITNTKYPINTIQLPSGIYFNLINTNKKDDKGELDDLDEYC